jgi:hypothetical protein
MNFYPAPSETTAAGVAKFVKERGWCRRATARQPAAFLRRLKKKQQGKGR